MQGRSEISLKIDSQPCKLSRPKFVKLRFPYAKQQAPDKGQVIVMIT